MKIKIPYLVLIQLLIILMKTHVVGEELKPQMLTFTLITFHDKSIADNIIKNTVTKITDILTNEQYNVDVYDPVIDKKNNYNSCINRDCINELKEKFPMQFLIIITITAEEIKTGQIKFTKYLKEDVFEKVFSIQVVTINPNKEKYDLKIKRSHLDSSKLNIETEKIGLKIAKYYKDIKLINNITKNEQTGFFIFDGMSFNVSYLYPSGNFSDIADYGYGINSSLNGHLKSFEYISINPELSFYKLKPSTNTMESAYTLLPEITFGYTFHPHDQISAGPIAGIGYSFIFIDGAKNSVSKNRDVEVFYNPEFNAGIETIYSFYQNYCFHVSASYGYIVEKDLFKPFGTLNFGIRMNL